MWFDNVKVGHIQITLTPEDAMRLALACRIAGDRATGDSTAPTEILEAASGTVACNWYASTSAALELASLAGVLDGGVPRKLAMTEHTSENLRTRHLLEPLWSEWTREHDDVLWEGDPDDPAPK